MILIGPVNGPSHVKPYSSHDDYTRLVHEGTVFGEKNTSLRILPKLQEESQVQFYHESGFLVVGGDKFKEDLNETP